jgi:ribosomal protein L21
MFVKRKIYLFFTQNTICTFLLVKNSTIKECSPFYIIKYTTEEIDLRNKLLKDFFSVKIVVYKNKKKKKKKKKRGFTRMKRTYFQVFSIKQLVYNNS